MILIRPFSPTDVPSVMAIVAESLGEDYPPSLYLTVHSLWREGFLVVVENKKLIGFVAAVPSGEKVARILMLAVLPQERKRSLAQKLMSELYSVCRSKGYGAIILEVRKSNRSAIAFYERQGFSVSGEMKNFYSNGEDAWKMMKALDN